MATSGGHEQMVVEGSNPNPNPRFESEMEGGSKRLGELELDAARALAEMAKIEVRGEEGGKRSSRKRINKESKARACGQSSHDLNISRSEMANAIKSKVEFGVGITSRHVDTSTSPSTELSLVAPIRPSITAWDPCPSISPNAAACYEEGGSSGVGASNTLFYVPPCSWFYPLSVQASECYTPCSASTEKTADFIASQHNLRHCLQERDNSERASLHVGSKTDLSTETVAPDEERRNVGINLEEMPIGYDGHDEISEHNASVVLTHSEEAVNPCPDVKGEQEVVTVADSMTDQLGTVETEKSQVASIPPLKKLVDPSAAAAARKRRKELTKLKYHRWRQIKLHV